RLERADLRAHQRRARGTARCAGRHKRRLQPRVLDAGRHAHGRAHFGRVPVSVRHRADPRIRGDLVHRPRVEPVHVDLRVEDTVRAGAGETASGGDSIYLIDGAAESGALQIHAGRGFQPRPPYVMHIFKNTNYDFLRWRWHAIALSWVVIIAGIVTLATKGIPKGIE